MNEPITAADLQRAAATLARHGAPRARELPLYVVTPAVYRALRRFEETRAMIKDLTGQPPSDRDIDEALGATTKLLVVGMTKLPPEIAVQLPNLRRCLIELKRLRSSAAP